MGRDVVSDHVAAVDQPHMQVHRVIDVHVVVNVTQHAVAELEAAAEANVVVDLVPSRSVVQIDIPTVIAAPTVVADHVLVQHVELHQIVAVFGHPVAGFAAVLCVVAVTAPAVEGAVVVSFLHGQEHVVLFQQVPTPFAFTDVDARPRHIVDAVSANGDVGRQADVHTGGLFFNGADVVDQIVVDAAALGVIVIRGATSEIHFVERRSFVDVVVLCAGGVDGADEADTTGSDAVDVAAFDGAVFVVQVEEHRVAAQVG